MPNATPKEVIHEIEEATCTRLHGDRAWCTDSADVKKKGVRAAVARFVSLAKAADDGRRILVDWLGTGASPVAIAQAQARAEVCATCPENKPGHAFLKLTADTVRAIAEQMQAKDAMKLRVEGEERLHACAVCACPLPLKVHVPLATILSHTDGKTLNAFPPHCWVETERLSL